MPTPTTWTRPYETVADSRVRKYLKEHRNMTDDEVSNHLQSFHLIGGIRAQLDILPGEPS